MTDSAISQGRNPLSVSGISPRRIVRARIPLLLVLIAATALAFSIAMPQFLAQANLVNLFRQASVLAIVASGTTFVIVAGEIDLSVGSVVALAAVLTAWLSGKGLPVPVILGGGLLAGLAAGAVNSLLVLTLGVPSFLATLGTLAIVRGAAMTLSLQPLPLRNIPLIRFFGATPGGLPVPVLIALGAGGVAWVLFNRSRFGIRTRAVGSGEAAARLAGLGTGRQKLLVLLLGSSFAAIGGIVLAGRTNYGMAQAGTGLELDAIAAVLLGGGRLGGGVGSIAGTLLATLLLTMIFTGIAALGLSGSLQDIAKGALVGIAIFLMRT